MLVNVSMIRWLGEPVIICYHICQPARDFHMNSDHAKLKGRREIVVLQSRNDRSIADVIGGVRRRADCIGPGPVGDE